MFIWLTRASDRRETYINLQHVVRFIANEDSTTQIRFLDGTVDTVVESPAEVTTRISSARAEK